MPGEQVGDGHADGVAVEFFPRGGEEPPDGVFIGGGVHAEGDAAAPVVEDAAELEGEEGAAPQEEHLLGRPGGGLVVEAQALELFLERGESVVVGLDDAHEHFFGAVVEPVCGRDDVAALVARLQHLEA